MFGGIAMLQVLNPIPFGIGISLMLFIIIGSYLYQRWKGNAGMELAEKTVKTFVLVYIGPFAILAFILLFGAVLLVFGFWATIGYIHIIIGLVAFGIWRKRKRNIPPVYLDNRN
jgi:hypothetical protein